MRIKLPLLILAALALALAASLGTLRAKEGYLAPGPLPPVPVPVDNLQSDAKIRLGAQLYFDPRLSGDNTISCATCHIPETGWAHHAATDTGIKGQVGGRNSGTIIDAAYMRVQFWDGRAGSLEEQALGPIQNPIEMGETLENVVRKLNAIPGYRSQFQAVFDDDVTADGIAKAIASFERTIITGPSPFDLYLAGDDDAIGKPAQDGYDIFNGKAHCMACHSGPTLSDQGFHNLGVGMKKANPDIGREAVTKAAKDRGRFKTPGLRNVAQTAPYMHDGSEPTLMDVVNFYDRGGAPNKNLDPLLVPLDLTPSEKKALVAFLESLTGPAPKVKVPKLPPDAPAEQGEEQGEQR